MAVNVTKWERRESADREAIGNAAFARCKAQRSTPGVTASRFFWANADEVAVLTEAESPMVFDEAPKPETASARFQLSDLARQTSTERWIDPRDGMSAYRTAGRPDG